MLPSREACTMPLGMSFFFSTSLDLLTLMLKFFIKNVLLKCFNKTPTLSKTSADGAINGKDLKMRTRNRQKEKAVTMYVRGPGYRKGVD